MFTGLIQRQGRLLAAETSPAAGSLLVHVDEWQPALSPGESVAVQGACLTVAECRGGTVRFDVLRETFDRTNLRLKRPGDLLNLERALRLGDPLGGHMVTGHVDGVGQVRSLRREGRDWVVEIACGFDLLADMVPKGSVACDGTSLTIAELREDFFSVHIIPHTWEKTSLGGLKTGDGVNIETDILGKYVRRLLDRNGAAGGVTWDALIKSGFVT